MSRSIEIPRSAPRTRHAQAAASRWGATLGALGLAATCLGCAHASAAPPVITNGPVESGHELAPAEAVAPVGPPRSFAPEGMNALLRFQLARVRTAPYAGQLSAFIANSGTWQVLAAGAGADPVNDVDVMACGTNAVAIGERGILGDRWTFVLRHSYDDAEVRRRIDAMSRSSGRTAVWSSSGGFASTPLPVDPSGFAPHAIVLTSAREVVVAPADEVERIASAAQSQNAARAGAPVATDPEPMAVAASASEVAMIDVAPRANDPATIRLPDGTSTPRIERMLLVVNRPESSGLVVDARFEFASPALARRTAELFAVAIRQQTDSTMARVLGIERMARAVTSRVDGSVLVMGLGLDDRQVGVVLGALALLH